MTILSDPPREIPATVTNFSGKGMQVLMDAAVDPSSVIQVELGNTLYFGEVCYCYPDRGGYRLGLVLEQVLTVSSDLTRLMEALHPPATSVTC